MKRMKGKMTHEVVEIIEGNPYYISKLEKKLRNLNKDYRYIPQIKFNGIHECFSEVQINK